MDSLKPISNTNKKIRRSTQVVAMTFLQKQKLSEKTPNHLLNNLHFQAARRDSGANYGSPDKEDTLSVLINEEDSSSNQSARSHRSIRSTCSVVSRKVGGKKKINQYIMLEQVGAGAFAKVKKVRSVEDNKLYAMKVLNKKKLKGKFTF